MSKAEKLINWLRGVCISRKQAATVLIIIVVGILGAFLLIISRKPPERADVQTPAPLVEVRQLRVSDIPINVRGYGTVTAKVEVEIAPQVSGNIVWVNPQLCSGGFIPAKEPILKIDPRDYELAVQQAEAGVAEAIVALDTEKAEAQVAVNEWNQLNPDTEPTSPLVLREPQIRRAEALLASAKARLATAKLNLERTVVSLPVDVRINSKQVDLGQYVSAGRTVASAYGTDAVEIEVPLENKELAWFDIPEGSLPANGKVSSGSGTLAKVSASFAGLHHTWTGYVRRTVGQVDRTSRLISVVVEVPRPFDTGDSRPPLVPGMFVEVEIQGRTLANAVAVPRDAVHEGNRIWLVNNDRLHIVDLKIVRADNKFAYALSGIEDGAVIITSSLDAVTDGMQVRAQTDAIPQSDPNLKAGQSDLPGND